MQSLADWKEVECIKCGYSFTKIIFAIVGDEVESRHCWILECLCGEAYEIEYSGSFDDFTFSQFVPNKGGPRIYLKDFIDNIGGNFQTLREPLTPTERYEILERDGFRCQLCGATAKHRARLEVDHKKPVIEGGTNDPSNLWTLCFTCNRGKRTKLIEA